MKLRTYQGRALDELWAWFGENPDGNPIVDASVGAGKSIMIAAACQRACAEYPGTRIVMLVPQKELLEQNLEKLISVWPGVDVGVYSASVGRKQLGRQITYATIDSIFRQGLNLGRIDLIMCDEVHLVQTKDAGKWRTFIRDILKHSPHARVIGWTGTPMRGNGVWLTAGEAPLFTHIATRVGMRELLDLGYLAPLVPAPTAMRLSSDGVRTSGDDYVVSELAKAVDKSELVDAVCDEIVQIGRGRRAWLVYCVTIEHAVHVCQALQARGIAADVVTGQTPKETRRRALADLRTGRLRALVNVAVLCLDSETEVLTRSGWVGIDGMTIEHKIACWNINDQSISFSNPKNVFRRKRQYAERMVSIKGNGFNFRVTEDHTVVSAHPEYKWVSGRAIEIVGKKRCIPVSGFADAEIIEPEQDAIPSEKILAARRRCNSYNYRKSGMTSAEALARAIDTESAVLKRRRASPSELSLDDCRFIGFWLGDGSLGGGRCTLVQSNRYSNIVSWFDKTIAGTGMNFSRHVRPKTGKMTCDAVIWDVSRGTGHGCQLVDSGYYRIEKFLNKNGSDLYWGLDVYQLGALLEGLWYADGNHANKSYEETKAGHKVCATQIDLFNLLQAICACRGYRSLLRAEKKRSGKDHHKQMYAFTWRSATRSFMGWARPVLEDEHQDEDVWSVESETGYKVTRRGGVVSITGNCTGFDAPMVDAIFLLRATKSPVLYNQIAGRGMRVLGADIVESVRNGKPDCLWADFTDTTANLGPVDEIKGRLPVQAGASIAPFKLCPQCGSQNPAGRLTCSSCGHQFPPPERIVHGDQASNAAVLSGQASKFKTVAIDSVTYQRYLKPDSPDSVRVNYHDGLRVVAREWVAFSSSNQFARRKAEGWWTERARIEPIPGSTDEALEWLAYDKSILRSPKEIVLCKDGKYDSIVEYKFDVSNVNEQAAA